MIYGIIFLILLGAELLYFKIADKYNIIDKPNERSSHSEITLRGGGIVFVLAILTAFALGYVSWPLTLSMLMLGVVSFVDDIKPLNALPRFIVHVIAAVLVFYDLQLIELSIWLIPVVMFLLLGWINAYNFMDGINGITVLYALVTIFTFTQFTFLQESNPLFYTMMISCIVFGIFNVRKKAKTFAGDVGSVSMAIFLAYFMIQVLLGTANLGFVLLVAVYSIDAIMTILMRIKRRERLSQPHRSHLYQYLANNVKIPHVNVSLGYAIIQLGINSLVIYLYNESLLTYPVIGGLIVLLTSIYCIIRFYVYKKYVVQYA